MAMQKKKSIKILITVLVPLLLLVIGVSFYFWNRYANKNNLLVKYTVDNSKELYLLGSIGKKHFNKFYNYSMEDLLSAIENINPDLIMIMSRKENYENYNVVDGDIDACVAYSYGISKDIPIEMIDWWLIDNIYPESATTNLRDDNIFIKITRILRKINANSKILVVANSKNFYEQNARFEIAGLKRQDVENVSSIFDSPYEDFHFPPLASKYWKDRSYFYAYVLPRLIKENNSLFESVKENFISADHDKFYRSQIKYCEYLNNDILYK